LYQRLRRWIDGIVAGLFAVAGLALIRSAVSR
ncbi:MAG: LysE family translocator, partial [Silicimonas sp.]|nr:LysE family translocator [Silicimonas sp.]